MGLFHNLEQCNSGLDFNSVSDYFYTNVTFLKDFVNTTSKVIYDHAYCS